MLLIETVKTLIQTQIMGPHEKNIKRISILHQSMSVLKWINNFQPTSVNLQNSMMPSELYETSEHTKLILSDLESKTPLGFLNSHKNTISSSLFGELHK